MTRGIKEKNIRTQKTLPKTLTGIAGFDDITNGGVPSGRPTLVCGEAGCGKTLFSIEFIVKGATLYNEPGVFVAFEEKAEELTANVASLGFDLQKLVAENKIRIDYIHIDRSEIEETGEYDLDGLFVRLGHAIDTIGHSIVQAGLIGAALGIIRTSDRLTAGLRIGGS